MAQLVTSMSGVVLGGVVMVVGSNLARGKVFTACKQLILDISVCMNIFICAPNDQSVKQQYIYQLVQRKKSQLFYFTYMFIFFPHVVGFL